MKRTYIVSGFMRSGTSMMMKALDAGGLEAVHNKQRNDMNDHFGDEHYKPNIGGFYELDRKTYQHPDFPRMFEGKLIKLLYGGMPMLMPGNYQVVFMRRHYEEIRQSYEAFFGKPPPLNEESYYHVMDRLEEILRVRRDVHLNVVEYRRVVEQPLDVFMDLSEDGWPIDPEKAAAVVDPDQCRYRLENLEIGA